ncbi:PREDICTED: lysozyme D-like [Nicrophorus vespilloides]|uniref:lysozyme n=1 Tax=Nicrophorus vespilloides TaxID=110193 RepID=A0ABM1M1I6_NICVS|nr:PREDICTED: lysozyme D-like [Nicrophorus vespilloides]XP_017768436.1 PREDICTED: lysozyme D-like [Nicrophorus vespilloides]
MSFLIHILLASSVLCTAFGRILSPDQFAKELRQNNVPEWMIPTWQCIAQHESNYNTAARNTESGDHGIFQISQIYWCSPPGTGCGVTCAAMENDDIRDDIRCAMHVYQETTRLSGNGFTAWTTYKYCH